MAIINHSSEIYNAHIRVPLAFEAEFSGNLQPQVYSPSISLPLSFEAEFGGEIKARIGGAHRLNFSAQFGGSLNVRKKLFLIEPEPILNEISENAFQNQQLLPAELLVNGVSVPFKSFNYQKPKGASGASLSIEMASAVLSQIPVDATYSFRLGEKVGESQQWTTLIENAKLDSRSHSLAAYNDTLSFSTVSPLADKLELAPRRNYVFYDGNKTQLFAIGSTGARPDDEPLFDTDGDRIPTIYADIRPLTLYRLLNEAFVKGCGFASYQTNIPNFEVTRCDFSISGTYLSAVAGLIGLFEPIFFAVDNVLWILDTTAAIPDDFIPRALTPSKFTRFDRRTSVNRNIDGYLLQYSETATEAVSISERLEQTHEEAGQFGDSGFTEIDTLRVIREWRNGDGVLVQSALIKETKEIHADGDLVGREVEQIFLDGQGRRVSSKKTVEALVPDLANDGEPSLQTVRDEQQSVFYRVDPRNPRRVIQDRSVTQIRGLIAVDAEEQYLGRDFYQDLMRAHEAGNLTLEMTTDYGPLRTITETLTTLGNGQIAIKVLTVDLVRNTFSNSISEVKAGDVSINAVAPKPKKIVVWKNGVNPNTRSGNRVEPLAVGELPIIFALPLAQRKLTRLDEFPHDANIEIMGFDESIERGVFFSVTGRESANLGIYLTEGFSISGEAYRIQTTIEAREI